MKNIKDVLQILPNKDLHKLAFEINQDVIPMDALIRKIVDECYPPGNFLVQILGVAPALAMELSERLDEVTAL